MSWQGLVIISIITASLSRILQKILLDNKNINPVAFGFIFGLAVSIFMFVWAIIEGFSLPDLRPITVNLISMSLLYSFGSLLLYKSFKLSEASEVSVLFSSSSLWALVSAIFLLNEQITPIKIIGTILIVLGISVLSYSKSKWNFNRGHLFALVSAVCIGVAFTNDAFIIDSFNNVSSYMAIAFLAPSINILAFDPKSIKQIRFFLNRNILLKLAITSILYGVSAIFMLQAYKNGGEASVVYPILQSNILLIVLFSYIFLKEKDRLVNKVFGAVFILIGVFLLK